MDGCCAVVNYGDLYLNGFSLLEDGTVSSHLEDDVAAVDQYLDRVIELSTLLSVRKLLVLPIRLSAS